jgi:hypothetical protein
MNEKELYQQKMQAQLDEWNADVAKLKARASGASADAQLKINDQVEALQPHMEQAKAQLAVLADAADDGWDTGKDNLDSAWKSLKTAVSDLAKS